MKCINRFIKYRDNDFDKIMLCIKNGTIKTGKYSNRIKINDNKKINRKELFKNG